MTDYYCYHYTLRFVMIAGIYLPLDPVLKRVLPDSKRR